MMTLMILLNDYVSAIVNGLETLNQLCISFIFIKS